ncbi:hypothetical protein FKM82_003219 [Ascaphus truei]
MFSAHCRCTISTNGHQVCKTYSQLIIHALYYFSGHFFSSCPACHGAHTNKLFSHFDVSINTSNKNKKKLSRVLQICTFVHC